MKKPARTPRRTSAKSAPARKKSPAAKRSVAKKKPAAKRKPSVGAKVENPAAHALARKIAALVLDKKAQEVVVLDVRGIASYADYVVIASGESDRQVSAMAESVRAKLKEEDHLSPVGAEGFDTGNWVLLDYGDVVAHLFYSEVRTHYDLEGLFADAPRESVR